MRCSRFRNTSSVVPLAWTSLLLCFSFQVLTVTKESDTVSKAETSFTSWVVGKLPFLAVVSVDFTLFHMVVRLLQHSSEHSDCTNCGQWDLPPWRINILHLENTSNSSISCWGKHSSSENRIIKLWPQSWLPAPCAKNKAAMGAQGCRRQHSC